MLSTRLTEAFDLKFPVIQAPMAMAAGGRLASSVAQAGGMGLIGGGYCDEAWVDQQISEAGNSDVGCGFITWVVQEKLDYVRSVLQRKPKALFASFGDPASLAKLAHEADVPLICQVQTMDHAKRAIECGAKVVVAQGSEAGGHGAIRATFTLVPEVADLIAKTSPKTLLCAAGGIADGRGLAAALMLGADGVVVGSRFWASQEALVHSNMHAAAIDATGDDTIRSSVMDLARKLNWPAGYSARVLKNGFTDRWHNNLDGLMKNQDEEADLWRGAWAQGNMDIANTFVGEVAGQIDDVQPAEKILTDMVAQAQRQLSKF